MLVQKLEVQYKILEYFFLMDLELECIDIHIIKIGRSTNTGRTKVDVIPFVIGNGCLWRNHPERVEIIVSTLDTSLVVCVIIF